MLSRLDFAKKWKNFSMELLEKKINLDGRKEIKTFR